MHRNRHQTHTRIVGRLLAGLVIVFFTVEGFLSFYSGLNTNFAHKSSHILLSSQLLGKRPSSAVAINTVTINLSSVTPSPSAPLINWFEFDPVVNPTLPLKSIWSREISLKLNHSRTDFQRTHPQLVFIKGVKVGGTTVAIALDKVARHYGIQLQVPIVKERNNGSQGPLLEVNCTRSGSLWYHHGYKSQWMSNPTCIPHARFVTVFRNPIAQALSFETFLLSRDYFREYPSERCQNNFSKLLDFQTLYPESILKEALLNLTACEDTLARQEITLQLVAHRVAKLCSTRHGVVNKNCFSGNSPGAASHWGITWAMSGRDSNMNSTSLLHHLQENFFLLGVTERLNEFLVVLALHMGWDLSRMYYIHCKPTNVEVGKVFKRRFPLLYQQLEQSLQSPYMEVYEGVALQFSQHISELRRAIPTFDDILSEFELGLKAYQAKYRSPHSFRWRMYEYMDGHTEYC